MSEPTPTRPGAIPRFRAALAKHFGTKTFVTGVGEQFLRAGQAAVALTGVDAYLKDPGTVFDFGRAMLIGGAGCVGIVVGLYLKSRGERL